MNGACPKVAIKKLPLHKKGAQMQTIGDGQELVCVQRPWYTIPGFLDTHQFLTTKEKKQTKNSHSKKESKYIY